MKKYKYVKFNKTHATKIYLLIANFKNLNFS